MNTKSNPIIEVPGESHLACVLLLDTSSSMSRNRAIESLNDGIRKFVEQVSVDDMAKKRLDVAIVEFNSSVSVKQDFLPISQMTPITLTASGTTAMGQGVLKAVEMAKARNMFYHSQGTPLHKPWIFMITDGEPYGESAMYMDEAVKLVRLEEGKGEHGMLKFWSLAVKGANKNTLRLFSERVLELDGHDFTGIFNWLAESMSCISVSQVNTEPVYSPLPNNVVPAVW